MQSAKHVIAGLMAVGLLAAVSIPAVAAPIGKLARPFGFHAAEQPSAQSALDQPARESSNVAAVASQASSPQGLAKGHVNTDERDEAILLAATLAQDPEPEDAANLQAKYKAIADFFAPQGVSIDQAGVQRLHTEQQLGLGEIVRLLSLDAKVPDKTFPDLLAEHQAGAGWGELAKKYGQHPGSLQNPGAVFGGKGKAGAAGGPPGLAKAKAKGAAKGQGASGK